MVLVSGCATVEDAVYLDQRITALEEKSSDYSHTRDEKDQALRNQSAELRALIQHLRREIQRLQGRLEETDFLLKDTVSSAELKEKQYELSLSRMETLAQSLEIRVTRLEEYLKIIAEYLLWRSSYRKTDRYGAIDGSATANNFLL